MKINKKTTVVNKHSYAIYHGRWYMLSRSTKDYLILKDIVSGEEFACQYDELDDLPTVHVGDVVKLRNLDDMVDNFTQDLKWPTIAVEGMKKYFGCEATVTSYHGGHTFNIDIDCGSYSWDLSCIETVYSHACPVAVVATPTVSFEDLLKG